MKQAPTQVPSAITSPGNSGVSWAMRNTVSRGEKTMSLDRKRKWGVHQFDDVTSQAGAQSTRDVVEEEEEGREKRSNSVRKRKFHFNILRRANSLQHGSDRHRHSTAASSSASGASSDVSLAHNSASPSHDLNTGSDSKDGMTSSASTVQSDCARQLSPIEDVLVQSADALSVRTLVLRLKVI